MAAFQENPIIGVGSRGAAFAIEKQTNLLYATHNTYLSVLLDLGIIGFIIFLSILALSLMQILNLRGYHRICFIVMLLTLLIGIFPLSWEANKSVWYYFMLFSIYSAYIIRDRKIFLIKRL